MRTLFRRVSSCIGFLVCLFLTASGRADTWTKADQSGQTAYFLHPSPPRVERYDMAAQSWLAPISLPAIPTALAADTNALFVACGLTIYRVGLDGSGLSEWVHHTNVVTELVLAGDSLVFKSGAVIGSLEKSTGILHDMRQYYALFQSLAYSPAHQMLLGIARDGDSPESYQYLYPIDISPDGGLAQWGFVTSLGFASNAFTRVSPDGGRIITAPGTVLNAGDLSVAGTLDVKVSDVAFNGDVIIALRGSNVLAYANTLQPAGSKSLLYLPDRVFTTKDAAFAFGRSADAKSRVARVPWVDLNAPEPGTPVDPTTISFAPDAVDADTNGVVYLLSGQYRSIFRWSVSSHSFLRTIPIADVASIMIVAPSLNRIYVGYKNGRITVVDLSAPNPSEATFNSTLSSLVSAALAGEDLLLAKTENSNRIIALDPLGQLRSDLPYQTFVGRSVWEPGTSRLYSASSQYLYWTGYTNGTLLTADSRYIQGAELKGILAISPDDNQLIAFSGAVVDLGTFSVTNSLGFEVTDAVWTQGGLQTLRAIGAYYQVHRWNADFEPILSHQALGTPFRMLSMDTNLVVVASNNGQIQFTVLDTSLSPIFVSPIQSGPTNITLSTSELPRVLTNGAVVATVTAQAQSTNETLSLSLTDSADGRFYLEGDQIKAYSQTADAGTTYFVTLRAEDAVRAGISKTFQLTVSSGFAPEVSMVLLRQDVFGGDYGVPVVELRRTGDVSVPLTVNVDFAGSALLGYDYYPDVYYGGQRIPFSFQSGSNALTVHLTSNNYYGVQEPPKTVELSLAPDPGYEVGTSGPAWVQLWDSRLDRWLYLRNGRLVSAAESAPDADPDGNGVPNFVEFHSGVPAAPTNGYVRPFASLDPVAQRLAVVFHRDPSLTDAERDLLVSPDLVTWSLAVPEEQVVATTDGGETVKWTVSLNGATTLFGNLRIAPIGHLRSPDLDVPGLGIHMVGLPNRSFYMGSPTSESGRYPDEGPQFTASFTSRSWMAEHEITQAQYTALMTNNPSWFSGDDLPVDGVTWDEANEFCRRLTAKELAAGRLTQGYVYRLPTEAEWESAARGNGVDYNGYPSSSTGWIPQQNAWYAANSAFQAHPVGSNSPNSWGLCDMEGNVAEWCSDWYGPYPFNGAVDPVGPVSGLYRVVRGGSFVDGITALRVAARYGALPSQGSRFIGFRVVLGVARE
jgi:formylglycine-generating enzyme required for sulfatase activity